jgi:hypothetical protein
MKKSNLIKSLFALSLLWSVFVINGCKKETPAKPVVTIEKPLFTPKAVNQLPAVDSTNYFKGTLGGEVVKFEGNAFAYSAYVDPDSAQDHNQGYYQPTYNSYYLSGSKWVSISSTGLTANSANASLEIRSLAVRVFVTPIAATSIVYYNLLGQPTYTFADGDNTNTGAYISLHDQNGVLWTSSGNQDGSTLTVTSRGAMMSTYTVLSGTISCKMYDPHGNMKQLTGANFTASLGI